MAEPSNDIGFTVGPPAQCYDCARPYSDSGFQDLVLPNDVWARISPSGDENGLLCPSCIVGRLHDAGITCRAEWRSGPLAQVSIGADLAKPYIGGPDEVATRLDLADSHAAIARNAALSLRQRAAMPGLEDLRELYLELARMMLGLAETIDARELEIGVLRVELAAANERAAANAENARLWFDRVAALGALPKEAA